MATALPQVETFLEAIARHSDTAPASEAVTAEMVNVLRGHFQQYLAQATFAALSEFQQAMVAKLGRSATAQDVQDYVARCLTAEQLQAILSTAMAGFRKLYVEE